jgi:hypothetical protein
MVMATNLTRLTHKIAIQLHIMAESYTICSSRSRRPVRKLLDTPSYIWHQVYQQNFSLEQTSIPVLRIQAYRILSKKIWKELMKCSFFLSREVWGIHDGEDSSWESRSSWLRHRVVMWCDTNIPEDLPAEDGGRKVLRNVGILRQHLHGVTAPKDLEFKFTLS